MKSLMHYIKSASRILQTKKSSFELHNAEYIQDGKVEREREFVAKMLSDKSYDSADNKISRILARYPDRELCIDIGSGNGWFSGYMSQFFKKAVGIEPSAAAISIAEQLYPAAKYPNITWEQGFAEEVLEKLPIDTTSTFFFTGCVLSHMRDKEVAAICKIINEKSKKGSALSFSECWGEEFHKHMWHVRTKAWWQAQLSNFELDFHGGQVENIPGRYKGFHGIKVR